MDVSVNSFEWFGASCCYLIKNNGVSNFVKLDSSNKAVSSVILTPITSLTARLNKSNYYFSAESFYLHKLSLA